MILRTEELRMLSSLALPESGLNVPFSVHVESGLPFTHNGGGGMTFSSE